MKNIEISNGACVLSHIYSGESIEDIASCCHCYDNIFIVMDRNLSLIREKLEKILHFKSVYLLDATEENKEIGTVMDICAWLMDHEANRDAFLLGIGGGITTDITGMAASIYKRGIRFAFMPTTLLAQTDAAIGGKNGVNFHGYKNMAGIIRQPEFTFECPEVLETLPYEDFLSGEAELIKSFIIENKDGNYSKAIRLLSEIHQTGDRAEAIRASRKELEELVMAAAAVKAGIVGRDQNECGERKKLNLGHTFAHAIEWKSGNRISHGKAVAIGMVMAARLSERLGTADSKIEEQLRRDLEACGLPTDSGYPIGDLAEAMKKDKKALNGKVSFILIRHIGEVTIEAIGTEKIVNIL